MELRTYILIDSMQPQFAALTGILLQGDVPVEGMAEVFMELAPASDVYEVLDTALKTADVRPGLLRVEREDGTLEIHSAFQKEPGTPCRLSRPSLWAGSSRHPFPALRPFR